MVKEGFGIAGSDLSIGADILIRAAISDGLADVSGKYFNNDSAPSCGGLEPCRRWRSYDCDLQDREPGFAIHRDFSRIHLKDIALGDRCHRRFAGQSHGSPELFFENFQKLLDPRLPHRAERIHHRAPKQYARGP